MEATATRCSSTSSCSSILSCISSSSSSSFSSTKHPTTRFPFQFPVIPSGYSSSSSYLQFPLKPNNNNNDKKFLSTKVSSRAFEPNVSGDTDDMYDDMFKKYGKVVFKRNDQKPPSAEIDDDAESLAFAVEVARVASDVKAGDIKVLFVKPLVYWTRFFIIATAFSRPQIDAIGSRVRDLAEKQYGKVPTGDYKPNSWTLLDFGDVVVHLFLPEQRDYYNLEEFYGNATSVELPFENQQHFRN